VAHSSYLRRAPGISWGRWRIWIQSATGATSRSRLSGAYAKRALTAAGAPEGAHEYVAAELARLVGIPVPPVGFYFDNKGHHFSLSIRAFPEAVHWDEVQMSDADLEALRPIFSASAVFHAWIADADHAGHPENLVVDPRSPEGRPRVAFIDHAMSLTTAWRIGDAAASLPQEYYIEPDKILRVSVLGTLQRVRRVSERVRESTILRVPSGLSPSAKAATILNCLRCRAEELGAAFLAAPGGS
jgi:hypothetical protein